MLGDNTLPGNAGWQYTTWQCWMTIHYLAMLDDNTLPGNAGWQYTTWQCWMTIHYLAMVGDNTLPDNGGWQFWWLLGMLHGPSSVHCAIVPLADPRRKPWKWVESNNKIIAIDYTSHYCISRENSSNIDNPWWKCHFVWRSTLIVANLTSLQFCSWGQVHTIHSLIFRMSSARCPVPNENSTRWTQPDTKM